MVLLSSKMSWLALVFTLPASPFPDVEDEIIELFKLILLPVTSTVPASPIAPGLTALWRDELFKLISLLPLMVISPAFPWPDVLTLSWESSIVIVLSLLRVILPACPEPVWVISLEILVLSVNTICWKELRPTSPALPWFAVDESMLTASKIMVS